MKRVVSVSLGSSRRDHKAQIQVLGEKYEVQRIGTNGSMAQAIETMKSLDGKVAAFGMGGIDLYIKAAHRKYTLRDAKKLVSAVKRTPIVDGSGLKDTLERTTVAYLLNNGFKLKGKRVLLVCGMDRFGLAEALESTGCRMTYGDFMFALGLPLPLHSLKNLHRAAAIVAPLASQLPFHMLYPTGKKQESINSKHEKYYYEADIIAGDFHYIRKHLPPRLTNKTIITNTVTQEDLQLLRNRGVSRLVSTTPEIQGRSFGTNVMEALLVAVAGASGELKPRQYLSLLEQIGFHPRVVELKKVR